MFVLHPILSLPSPFLPLHPPSSFFTLHPSNVLQGDQTVPPIGHYWRTSPSFSTLLHPSSSPITLHPSKVLQSDQTVPPMGRYWYQAAVTLQDLFLYGRKVLGRNRGDVMEKIKAFLDPDYKFSTRYSFTLLFLHSLHLHPFTSSPY